MAVSYLYTTKCSKFVKIEDGKNIIEYISF